MKIQKSYGSAAAAVLGMALVMTSTAHAEDAACIIQEGQSFHVPVFRPEPKKTQSSKEAAGPKETKKAVDLQAPYDMNIFIQGGGTHRVQVDTGSTGIVVSRASVPDSLWQATTRDGVMPYSSDGLNLFGRYVTRRVKLGVPGGYKQNEGDSHPITVPIDILVVDCACDTSPEDASKSNAPAADLKNIQSCESLNNTSASVGQVTKILTGCKKDLKTNMMGVGFNRGSGSSANNPFLQLEAVQKGIAHAGYVIKEQEIELGLTPRNTSGFQFVRLDPDTRFPTATAPVREWMQPQACVRFRTEQTPLCGSMLMDTGIDYMMLTIPSAQRPAQFVKPGKTGDIVPPGTPMTLTLPLSGHPILTYAFTLNKDMKAPAYVSWRGAQGTVQHINTGRHLMVMADYAYDAHCGQLGFRARP